MKVLYIGHYKERSGWADATINNILALDKAGVDVVCRNITLTSDNIHINRRIIELERRGVEGSTHCIQHVLPHHLVGSDQFEKNIAYLDTESKDITSLNWYVYLNKMSEVWVPCRDSMNAFSGRFKPPIKIVPHCVDAAKYETVYRNIRIGPAEGKFKFYYIGDMNDRKNIRAIIRCFHSEFDKSEPACLILKVRRFGKKANETRAMMDAVLAEEKQKLRMYPNINSYAKDILITDDTSDDDIMSLHQHCDCFISPSHGEGWSIPAFDAMAFGKTPIVSAFGGTNDFIDDDTTGKLVDGVFAPCQCSDAAFPDMFTGREEWFVPCETSIKRAMRYYFEKRNDKEFTNRCRLDGLEKAKDFSHEKVGQLMKGLLSE